MSDSVKKTQNDIEWINSTGIRKKEKIKATKNENPSTSWNKGLTKETDIRLLKTSVSIKESWRVKPIEEKEILRKRQRDITLKRIIDHPNKRFSNTKPERLFKKFLDDLQIKYNHNYPIWGIEHSYPADFFLPDYNIVIEVDGKKWHNFPTYTDKDLIREIELNNKGYVLFRIWEDMVEIIAEIPEVFLEYLEAIKKDFTGTILNKKLY
jgi:very-short-patch-repair endonuclease